jgi:uncharacterized caspase-like protein
MAIARDGTVAAASEAGDIQLWESKAHSPIARILEPGRGSSQGPAWGHRMRWDDERRELWVAWGGDAGGCARYDRTGARIGDLMNAPTATERAAHDDLASFCVRARTEVMHSMPCIDGRTTVRIEGTDTDGAALSLLNADGREAAPIRMPVPRATGLAACTGRHAIVYDRVLSPDGQLHEGIELVALRAGAQPVQLEGYTSSQPDTFSPDGRFVRAFKDGDLLVYDAETARLVQTIHGVHGAAAIGGDPLVIVTGAAEELRFYDGPTGRLRAVVGAARPSVPYEMQFLNDDLLAFGLHDGGRVNVGRIRRAPWAVVSMRTGEARRIEAGSLLWGPPLGITPDGNLLVFRGALEVWRGVERLPRAQRYVKGAPWPPPPGGFAVVPAVDAEYDLSDDESGYTRVTRRGREAFDFETGKAVLDDEHDALSVVDVKTGSSVPLKPPRFPRMTGQERPEQTRFFAHGTRAYSRWAWGIVVWDTRNGAVIAEAPSLDAFVRAGLARARRAVPGYLRGKEENACDDIMPARDGKTLVVSCRNDFFFVGLDAGTVESTPSAEVSGGRPRYWLPGGSQDEIFFVEEPNRVVRWKRGEARVSASVAGVDMAMMAVSPDGRTLATSSQEGRVQIWDGRTLALRATLLEYDDGEALMFSPGGAYAGTPEASARVAWGFGNPDESFGFAQFASTFAQPDILARRLRGEDVDVTEHVRRPPRVDRLKVEALADGSATVTAHVETDGRVDRVRLFDEGVQVAETTVCAPSSDVSLRASLLRGANRVSLVAYDDHGYASNVVATEVLGAARSAPALHIVAVGINEYPAFGPQARLSFAVSDAGAIASAFHELAGPGKMYSRVAYERVLLDADASAQSIQAALQPLAQMAPDDLAIVFLAGHGAIVGARHDMVFVTGKAGPETVAEQSVHWEEIGRALASARGRVVVLLDACHSGNVVQDLVVPDERLATDLARRGRAGVLVFSAAKGRQASFEPGNARGLALETVPSAKGNVSAHGFFTGAILAALGSPATDLDGDGALEVSELIDEVTRRVATASKNLQTPWVARQEVIADFRVAPRAE